MKNPGSDSPEEGPSPDSGAAFGSLLLRRLAERSEPSARYRNEGEIARGGQGVVLRVWDQDLQRHLAMKVILGERGASSRGEVSGEDSRALRRFLEEAHVTGQLDHPGIVPVHEIGLDSGGRVYFTMKLVKGRDLGAIFDLVREGREGWTHTRALNVILKVCEALAYAHSKGVIHRDLKPANVMVGEYGEVFVMDWGLARVAGTEDRRDLRLAAGATASDPRPGGDSPLVTMEGDVLGTPAYMSPEQARGDLDAMGPSSDVYSAGALLYELLTGHMPYVRPDTRPTAYDVWSNVQKGPPDPLLERAPGAPPELVAICEKAMAREVGHRYHDTEALASDLRAFLEQRVVSAYETGALAELRKWVTRNKALASSIAAAALAVVGGLLWAQSERAARREQATRAALERSERDRGIESGVSLALGRAGVHAEQGQWEAAQASVDGARVLARTAESPEQGLAVVGEYEESIRGAREAAQFVEDVGHVAQRIDVLFDWAETDAKYTSRFSAFGVDVDGASPEQVAAALAERGVGAEVVPSVDRWLVVRRNLERERAQEERRTEDLAGALQLVEVACKLDDDELRADLRAALLEDDPKPLKLLAEDALKSQPPSTIALLGTALKLAGEREDALRILRAGVLRHPADYGLRTTLLTNLRQSPVTPEWDREECLDALIHTQAALALRPDEPDLRANMFWGFMGLAWDAERRGDLPQLRTLCEQALAQLELRHEQRFYPSELLFRGWALAGAGREELAREALATLVRNPPPFGYTYGRTPAVWRYWYFSRAGSLLLRWGALDDALLAFEPLLEMDTGPAFGEWALARVLLRAREGDADGALRVLHECLDGGHLEAPRASYWVAWSVARLPVSDLLAACGASIPEEEAVIRPALAAVQAEVLGLVEELDDASVDRVRAAAGAPPWPKNAQPRWTVLGMLRYRNGDPAGALEALAQVHRQNAYEWYFLAMAQAQLGRAAEARADYERAWTDTAQLDLATRGWDDLFDHLVFREETETLLGVRRGR